MFTIFCVKFVGNQRMWKYGRTRVVVIKCCNFTKMPVMQNPICFSTQSPQHSMHVALFCQTVYALKILLSFFLARLQSQTWASHHLDSRYHDDEITDFETNDSHWGQVKKVGRVIEFTKPPMIVSEISWCPLYRWWIDRGCGGIVHRRTERIVLF